jgi:hypothetical protein
MINWIRFGFVAGNGPYGLMKKIFPVLLLNAPGFSFDGTGRAGAVV